MKEAVCLILKNSDGLILGVSRKDNHELFGFIGGKKDDTDKDAKSAIIRECFEETGIIVKNLKLIDSRIYGISEETTYLQHCFIGEYSNEPLSNEELLSKGEGVLKWLTEEEITCGFFGEYNKLMLEINDNVPFWHDAKTNLPKRTKGSYSDQDVLICQMYKSNIGRTYNNKWVDMKNEELNDVILWAYIPKIPKNMHSLFD